MEYIFLLIERMLNIYTCTFNTAKKHNGTYKNAMGLNTFWG